ncbi:MAG: hypothetical protein H7Y32_04295, partial [Chloroflexales bacterium]|nr:hypothetical protein [Chloroflexales bacterium]
GCGLLVLLRFLGAFNALDNPRVLMPSLPALAVLAGGGWASVQARWRWSFGGAVVALLLLGNANLSAAQREYYVYHRSLQPVWEQLRAQPHGFVLAPDEYWNTLWQGGQPVTAFEGDPTFQRNILHNADNFRRYTRANQIRYAIVPKPETPARVAGPLNGIDIAGMYGPDVLRYLDTSATAIDAGWYWVYILEP